MRLLTDYCDLAALISAGPGVLEEAVRDAAEPLSEEYALLAPIKPGKIVGIGLNYLDHIREAGLEPPSAPRSSPSSPRASPAQPIPSCWTRG